MRFDSRRGRGRRLSVLVALTLTSVGRVPCAAQGYLELGADDTTKDVTAALIVKRIGTGGRLPVHVDALEAELVAGRRVAPQEGQELRGAGGEAATWKSVSADAEGWIRSDALRAGYAYVGVRAAQQRIMILEACGHSVVYVNGEPRVGDPYSTGYVALPILLRAGENDLLFAIDRGGVKARLVRPRLDAFLSPGDLTLPDMVSGELLNTFGAVVVVNASERPLTNTMVTIAHGTSRPFGTPFGAIPALSVRKVAFRIQIPPQLSASATEIPIRLGLAPAGGTGGTIDELDTALRFRQNGQSYTQTFRSRVDQSVQYYAVQPALVDLDDERPAALVLSLHGAGVEATGQVDAYARKSWAHIVAPTNRRPFGFDWEDWGRLDALEVLETTVRRLKADPQRVYLTGHSMGGHGVWSLGAIAPDQFGALGPSAGWISFATYSGGGPFPAPEGDSVAAILSRAAAMSDTLQLLENYRDLGIYILHGDADDNVPVAQARQMAEKLNGFHRDYVLHEEPGQGHWWDLSDEPGSACVDWPPLFDFFARHRRPRDAELRQVRFTTLNPAVSASAFWARIEAQEHALQPSVIDIQCDPQQRRFHGTTRNVATLALDVGHLDGTPVLVELDGQELEPIERPADFPRIWLSRSEGQWRAANEPDPAQKRPARGGPFKQGFQNRPALVYGTQGTPEENAWALAKARYDAEVYWYRGNAELDVLPDTEFKPRDNRDRNVVLYGNAETNRAWAELLADSPIQVRAGSVTVHDRTLSGDDLACLFLRPRGESAVACVGVVAGTGPAGMRLTDRLPYFVSGVHYPDWIVLGADTLEKGMGGVRAAGFFGNDWTVESGDAAFRE